MKSMLMTVIAVTAAVLILFISGSVMAQPYAHNDDPDYFTGLESPSLSLLDPSRISTSHSYTFSYYSGNGRSGSIGMLMNSIEYRVSDPLRVTVDLGILHNPSAIVGHSQAGISPVIVPGIRLQYRPSNNIYLQMNIESYPAWYGNGYGGHGYYQARPYYWDQQ